MAGQRDRFTKKERSWILYDWANSVYATNIMAAIFPILFVSAAGDMGDTWWGYGTSIATFIVAILAPFLGAVGDFKGMKKKLFTVFMGLGVVSTLAIAFAGTWQAMLVFYIISRIGFAGSNLFYDSFLTDVTTNERMDRVSSWGYAMGYIGGSTIPFVLSIVVLTRMGYSNPFAQKFSIVITSLWWFVFTIPFFKNVEQVHYLEAQERPTLRTIVANTLKTARDIFSEKGMLLFILAYFFYIDGVGTVISISTAYGASLGLGASAMILALLVTQIVAMPCSILFGRLAQKISTRKALLFAIAVYMFICLVGFVMGFTLEPHQDRYNAAFEEYTIGQVSAAKETFKDNDRALRALDAYTLKLRSLLRDNDTEGLNKLTINTDGLAENDAATLVKTQDALKQATRDFAAQNDGIVDNYRKAISFSSKLFWAMAVLVGTVQGGIQATSRSYFGKLLPKKRSNEYFGFFDIFGKFASVIGPLLYAAVSGMTGRSSLGTLCLAVLFLLGFIILVRGKDALDELERSRLKA